MDSRRRIGIAKRNIAFFWPPTLEPLPLDSYRLAILGTLFGAAAHLQSTPQTILRTLPLAEPIGFSLGSSEDSQPAIYQ